MSQQQQQDNNDALYIIGAIVVVVILAKIFLGDYVLQAHLFLRHLWLEAMLGLGIHTTAEEAANTAYHAYALSEWTAPRLAELSRITRWIAFPVLGGILGVYGWKVVNKNPASKFKRQFNMNTLAASETREWPWMLPFLNLDLVNASISEGPYAMAMTEVEFVLHYRLLESTETMTLNEDAAHTLFSSQLGRLWEGFKRLRKHERALIGAFLPQICGEGKEARKETVEALEQLTRSFAAGDLDTSRSEAMLQKYQNHPKVKVITERHAYVSTVMCALLARARLRGKIPPAMMGWLMTYDRPLLYVIQNLGRKTPFSEGAGVYAHYEAEKVAGHRFAYPCVEAAVDGLQHELKKVKLAAEDEI